MSKEVNPSELPLPPGSYGLPILGQTLSLLKNNNTFFSTRYEKYGPVFKTKFGSKKVVCFVGHDALTFFYDPSNFGRAGANGSPVKDLFNYTAIPLIDGDEHRVRKLLYLSTMAPEKLAPLIPLMQNTIQRFIARWERMRSFQWQTENEFLCLGLGNALMLGDESGSADPDTKKTLDTYIKGLTSIPINLGFNAYAKALRARDTLLNLLGRSIDDHLARIKAGNPMNDLLTMLLQANLDAGSPLTSDTLRTDSLHVYFSVYIGLGLQVGFVQIALAQNRAAMDRARAEVMEHSPAGPVTADALGKMPYVRWIAMEARRLNPVLPITFLALALKTTAYNGYQIPQGWTAIASLYATMRDPSVFPSPETFSPDRFAPDPPLPLPPNSYVPHGGGDPVWHKCLGQEPANLFLELVIVLLLRGYTWELVPGQDLSNASGNLFASAKSGIQVVFQSV